MYDVWFLQIFNSSDKISEILVAVFIKLDLFDVTNLIC